MVSVEGTWPTTYQWYRGTPQANVKLPAPQGIQPALVLKPTDVSGTYYCIATNQAGSSTSPLFRLSYTGSLTAADIQVTLKKP